MVIPSSLRSQPLACGLFLAGAFLAFLAIRQAGLQLEAPVTAAVPSTAAQPGVDVALHVLAALAAILALGAVLSRVFRAFGQPGVLGEVVAGIALGPSLLGAVWPEASQWLIPDASVDPQGQVIAALKAISQLGIVLSMFLVGLDLNLQRASRRAAAAVAIAQVSIVVPFLLGSALALWLYPRLAPPAVPFTSFALFLGVAMSITAFPVLARILVESRLERTDLGVVALCSAATADVVAWCLLALVVGISSAQVGSALVVTVAAAVFVVAMFLIVRPMLDRWIRRLEQRAVDPGISVVLVVVLLAAWTTEAIGVHAVFGAFVLGALVPHDSRLARDLQQRLNDVVNTLLLPAFFAVTGMNTRIGLISGVENWILLFVLIVAATVGKVGGTLIAARMSGFPWRASWALGALMNARGMMELIVLNIGYSLGIISAPLFAMLVLMALVTTLLTAPTLRWLVPDEGSAALP